MIHNHTNEQTPSEFLEDIQPQTQYRDVLGDMTLDDYVAIDRDLDTAAETTAIDERQDIQPVSDTCAELETEAETDLFSASAADNMLKQLIRHELVNGHDDLFK